MASAGPGTRAGSVAAIVAASLILVAGYSASHAQQPQPVIRKQVWLTPDSGSTDMQALFGRPDEWPKALSQLSVFKFYEGQVSSATLPYYFPDQYPELRAAGAFSRLTRDWHKEIAIEVGVVKPQYCSSNGSAEEDAIRDTIRSIWDVEAGGGRVNYLAIDESFFAQSFYDQCGNKRDPALAADRIAHYVHVVQKAAPGVRVGLIEPYPALGAVQLGQDLDLLRARGISVPFLHLDVAADTMTPAARARAPGDFIYLADLCRAAGTRFGVIYNGDNGDSPALYANGVALRLQMVKQTFGDWANLPDDLIFQSWAESSKGQRIVPPNLPETTLDTHTNLLDRGLLFLRGASSTF